MNPTLDHLPAFCMSGLVVELILHTHTLKLLHCEFQSTDKHAYLDDTLRPHVREVQDAATRFIQIARDALSKHIETEEAEEEYEDLVSAWLECTQVGRDLASHLQQVSNYLRYQRILTRDSSTVRGSRKAKPVNTEHHRFDLYLDHLEKMTTWGSNQVTGSLRTATFSSFTSTSLTEEQVTAAIHDILISLRRGAYKPEGTDVQHNSPLHRCIHLSAQARLDLLHNIADEPTSQALIDTMLRRKAVLTRFHFRQISDRIEEVDIAYRETLEWMFRDDEYKLRWSSFPDFLKGNADLPYWLNGKAGSGKSTLLRFLIRHDKATQYLRTWTGARRLMTAHFFAWNLGTSLQKTRIGLLQSLIHQVLDTDQTLIHQVFPDLWHNIDLKGSRKDAPPSLVELKRAFIRLLNLTRDQRCFCFFVDGIDEFVDEDISETADLLLSLQAPNLKFVLSSRPIDICLDKFAACPQLRLQDLTSNDIRIYIDGKLSSNNVMLDLMNEDATAAQELIRELEERASGVFLWVRLVVSSLLVGLKRGDDIDDLKIRLRALPPDLEKLYATMFSKMEPGYLRQAATLFRLVRCALEYLDGQVMPTQFLAVGYNDFRSVIDYTPIAFDTSKLVRWCKVIDRQLVSRCCGLVEISYVKHDSDWWHTHIDTLPRTDADLLASHVQFLHRTVAEYLYEPNVWSTIMGQSLTFEPFENLAYAALHMMKIAPLADKMLDMQAYAWAQILVRSARDYERSHAKTLQSLLNEMDLVLGYHCPESCHWSSLIEIFPADGINAHHRTILSKPLTDIKSFAAFVGLGSYLSSKIESEGLTSRGATTQQMMLQTLFSQSDDWTDIDFSDKVDVVCRLLQHGADPNESRAGSSLWQYCLEHLLRMICTRSDIRLKVKGHDRRGDRARPSYENKIENEVASCSCSLNDCSDWTQLVVACVNAGADLIFLRDFGDATLKLFGESRCYFARLCRAYSSVNQTEAPMTDEEIESVDVESFSGKIPAEPCKNTSYGSSTVSGSAKAHFGDAYDYRSNVVVNNYYNTESHHPSSSTMGLSDTLEKTLTSSNLSLSATDKNSEDTVRERVVQLEAEVITAIKRAKSSQRVPPIASTEARNAIEEADFTTTQPSRKQRVNRSTNRRDSNDSDGHEEVSSKILGTKPEDGMLLYDVDIDNEIGELRIVSKESSAALSEDDSFDESDTRSRVAVLRKDTDDADDDLPTERRRRIQQKPSMWSNNRNLRDRDTTIPNSRGIAIPMRKKERSVFE